MVENLGGHPNDDDNPLLGRFIIGFRIEMAVAPTRLKMLTAFMFKALAALGGVPIQSDANQKYDYEMGYHNKQIEE